MKSIPTLIAMILVFLLSACSQAAASGETATLLPAAPTTQTPTATQQAALPTAAASPTMLAPEQSIIPRPSATPQANQEKPLVETPVTASSSPKPFNWQELPVIPTISSHVIEIYQHGLELGNNPYAFSKIGDCGSTPAWFLGDFDRGPRYYNLGDHQNLEAVIAAFQGSFSRTSLAAKSGFNASSVFAPIWADRTQCQPNETPLACEIRVHKPSLAFIMLGSNDVFHPDKFEPQMRRMIEFLIDQGVVPMLSTKADNAEGDGSLNSKIAQLASEYDLPLLNYWRAVQPLPDHGLQEDGVHITWGPNQFNDPQAMQRGWPVRNLTSLEMLDAVWHAVANPTLTP